MGIWSKKDCICECVPPWLPEDNCATCAFIACENGSELNYESCQCECTGHWMGERCDVCPSIEELILAGLDCGTKGFDDTACECRGTCQGAVCQHGSETDDKRNDCICDCAKIPMNLIPAQLLNDTGYQELMGHTFWAGDQCEKCPDTMKAKCEDGGEAVRRVFNTTICACSHGPCPLVADACKNGGTVDSDKCACTCAGNWTGPACETKQQTGLLGLQQDQPAESCAQILKADPNATDDTYWLKSRAAAAGKPEAVEVRCDMEGPDEGGWMQIAVIAKDYETVELTKTTYNEGNGSISSGDSFVMPCATLDPGHDRVEMRLTIGDVRDFFKPIPGATLCDMLTSQSKHLWSASNGSPKTLSGWSELLKKVNIQPFGTSAMPGDGNETEGEEDEGTVASLLQLLSSQGHSRQKRMSRSRRRLLMEAFGDTAEPKLEDAGHALLAATRWVQPKYITEPKLAGLLGGCEKGWPRELDDREYLSLWGGDKGGCCHYDSSIYGTGDQQMADEGSWGRHFQLHIRNLDDK